MSSTLYREVPAVKSETNKPRKDIVWCILEKEYVVRNVPYTKINVNGEEFISAGVSVKLELIRKLMLMNEIPHDVNFNDVADLKFSN